MDEMLSYIFSSMKHAENAMRHTNKIVVSHEAKLRTITMLSIALTVGFFTMSKRIREQDKVISKLKEDIEELEK